MILEYTKEFKVAGIGLLLEIIQDKKTDKKQQYYKLFQKELNVDADEFENIFDMLLNTEIDTDENVELVINDLNKNQHKIMHFLMMLNRCIILDGCDMESYKRFEKIRDIFLEKLFSR